MNSLRMFDAHSWVGNYYKKGVTVEIDNYYKKGVTVEIDENNEMRNMS